MTKTTLAACLLLAFCTLPGAARAVSQDAPAAAKAEVQAENPADLFTDAMALWREGRLKETLALLDQVIALSEDDPGRRGVSLAIKSTIRMELNDLDGALADAQASITAAPYLPVGYTSLGVVHMQRKECALAIDDFDRALAISPAPFVRSSRISAYICAGEFERALVEVQLEIAGDPESAEAQQRLGQIYRAMGKADASVEAYRKAAALAPENPDIQTDLADMLVFSTTGDSETGKAIRAEAFAIYSRVIAIRPSPYVYVARSQSRLPEDFEGKRADITYALDRNPQSAFALTALASLSLSEKKNEEAIARATAVIAMDPESFQAYQVRAIAYEKLGQNDLAIKDWDYLKVHDPYTASWFNGACWRRATLDKDLDIALADCREAVRLKPETANYVDSLAFVQFRLGNYAEAIAGYDRAIALDPAHASYLFMRGIAKRRIGDTAGGEADIAAAREISPEVAETYAGYGVTP